MRNQKLKTLMLSAMVGVVGTVGSIARADQAREAAPVVVIVRITAASLMCEVQEHDGGYMPRRTYFQSITLKNGIKLPGTVLEHDVFQGGAYVSSKAALPTACDPVKQLLTQAKEDLGLVSAEVTVNRSGAGNRFSEVVTLKLPYGIVLNSYQYSPEN